jgi:hypothetical protein
LYYGPVLRQPAALIQAGNDHHLALHGEMPAPGANLLFLSHFQHPGCGSNYRSRLFQLVGVTNEFILAAITEGRLSSCRALEIGVLAIDGERQLATLVQDEMLARMTREKTGAERRIARKLLAPWGRNRRDCSELTSRQCAFNGS